MKWRALFAMQHGRQGARLPLTPLVPHATIIPAHILWGVSGHVHTPNCVAFRDNAQRPNGRNALHSTQPFRRRSCTSSEHTPPVRASVLSAPAFLILRIQTTNHKHGYSHMQSYFFIGGAHDSINVPVADDTDVVQLHKGVTDKDNYLREMLSVGDAFITIYRHESLTPEQALNRLVEYYKAWVIHMPNGRR